MASEEDEIPLLNRFSPSFDQMSIEDLNDYIDALKSEITKTETIIVTKQKAEQAANSIFKS